MGKTTVGDAYKQKRGDLRHYAEAVEICLKANEDDIIHIENYGDISTLTTSIEVKDLEEAITLGSYQIWNTLKNWVVDFQQFNQFDKLLLLSTSPVVSDKSIPDWNEMTKENKLKKLVEASNKIRGRKNASKEKIKLFDEVFKFNDLYTKNDLLDILDRFHICLSSVNDKEKYQELEKLDLFKLHTKAMTKTIISDVIYFIFRKGLEGDDKWQINISELHRVLKHSAYSTKKKLPKLLKKYDDISIEDYEETVFVDEMKKIELDVSEIELGIGDYCRTYDTIIDLIDENILFEQDIMNYRRGELYRYLNGNKKLIELESGEKIQKSKKNFFNCLYKIDLIDLESIDNETFFQRGNIHSIVDDGLYRWLIDED
ncbi:hypothetical protein [Kordia sp.]|uniref:hypothetical protein n=1 Tax=Kordia sp. TaxID=1965332 RepID=UPI003D6C45B0